MAIRLGAVTYLNARPLVYGLEHSDRFEIRYDIPSECARLLHAHETDLGLIPSIEYLRGPEPYALVPGPAVISRGTVASVAIYTRKELRDVRTIAMHVVAVLCLAALAAVADLGPVYLGGVALVALLLVYEQSLVSADDLSQVKLAFDLNGYVGILYLVVLAVSIYAS